ncbi:hypothetical protein, partial [Spirosoma terrae]
MLMDSDLLPIYKKALNNDPEAILKFGEILQTGKGIVNDDAKAAEWYEKLLSFRKKIDFVDYALLYYWGAIAAWNRQDNKTALKRLKKSYVLFLEKYPDEAELEEQLQA